MKKPLLIDVHSHILPELYASALIKSGVKSVDGFPTPKWSIEDHLEMMEQNSITTCMLSVSSPGLSPFGGSEKKKLNRTINEMFSEIKVQYPSKFGAFALLSLPDVDSALAEIAYALDVLKLDGVGLYSNYNGVYLGDELFDPIFEELNKRKVTVFVHPTAPPALDLISLGFPAPMIEYPFDSTRMVCSLLKSHTISRYSDVKIIVPHGGGTVPYLALRISKLVGFPANELGPEYAKNALTQISSLYYDLTSATHPAALFALQKIVPSTQLLMGFDFPFMYSKGIPPARKEFRSYENFNSEDQRLIESGNALDLFPQIRAALNN